MPIDTSRNEPADAARMPQELTRRQFAAISLAAGASVALPAVSAASQAKEPAVGKPSRNVAIYRRFIEQGFNQGDLALMDEIAAVKYQEHEYLAPTNLSGPETLKVGITETRKAVKDMHMTIEDMAESGDKIWARLIVRGNEATTGKPVVMTAMDVCRFQDGKIVEHWGVPDRFALMHQLGMLPPGMSGTINTNDPDKNEV